MPDDPIAQPDSGAELAWRTLIEFTLPAAADHASKAVQQVIAAVADFQLSSASLEQLAQTIVETVHNVALQNGRLRLELPMQIRVSVAALADRDAACCWGFFVIARTVDGVSAADGPAHHAIEVFLYQESTQPHQTAA
jgi:hypothetical protein